MSVQPPSNVIFTVLSGSYLPLLLVTKNVHPQYSPASFTHTVKVIIFANDTFDLYRPQRSWGKVMFSQACVILFTGGCLPQCMLGYYTPLGNRHPPQSRHSPQSRHPPSRADTPLPCCRHPQEQTPPRDTATAADGTHPTGMHSCLKYV